MIFEVLWGLGFRLLGGSCNWCKAENHQTRSHVWHCMAHSRDLDPTPEHFRLPEKSAICNEIAMMPGRRKFSRKSKTMSAAVILKRRLKRSIRALPRCTGPLKGSLGYSKGSEFRLLRGSWDLLSNVLQNYPNYSYEYF